MIAKKTLIVAGVALLVTAMLAGATAHLTARNANGTGAARSFGVGGPANPDPCRRNSISDAPGIAETCSVPVKTGVSGNFYGQAGAIVFKTPVALNNPRVEVCNTPEVRINQAPCADGTSLALLAPTTLFPNGGVSAGSTLCDMEVLGDGSDDDTQQVFDELVVDSAVNDSPDKRIPDGVIDDGGSGGACHVAVTNTHYAHLGYKTSGCPGNVAGTDYAQGGKAWFGVGCNAVIATSGSAPGLSTCLVNAAIGSDKAGQAQKCVDTFTKPPGTGGSTLVCGTAQSTVSLINFGEGTGRGGAGIPYPTLGAIPCPSVDSSGVVFAFGSVNVDTTVLSPLLGGWIDASS